MLRSVSPLLLVTILGQLPACGGSDGASDAGTARDSDTETDSGISSGCAAPQTHEAYHGGAGTPEEPFLLCAPEQLAAVADRPDDWDSAFVLGTSLDMAEYDGSTALKTLRAIGRFSDGATSDQPFTGRFDGRSFQISNVALYDETGFALGLFGSTSGALIQNIVLTRVTVIGTDYVGGLIGRSVNSTVRKVSIASGQVVGASRVGGLIGFAEARAGNAQTDDCSVGGQLIVSGRNVVGGLVGWNGAAGSSATNEIIDSRSDADVQGLPNQLVTFGGFVGIHVSQERAAALIRRSSSTGTVRLLQSGVWSGAFIGTAAGRGGDIEIEDVDCSGTFEATGWGTNPQLGGGLIGKSETRMGDELRLRRASFRGSILMGTGDGPGWVGGLIGIARNQGTTRIEDSYASLTVQFSVADDHYAGGLLGTTVGANAGGIRVSRSYSVFRADVPSTGTPPRVGSIAGIAGGRIAFDNCYFDADVFQVAAGDGQVVGVTGLVDSEAHLRASYQGFDFNSVWRFDDAVGYPALR